ncbi:metallophosphoesterase [Mollicutes bacterium LVI A0039]|nr:metallophosphoesterase [Mollicutes bacterium LVI A0039]
MNKVYLTSDIHSKNTVFELLGDKITKDTPLYILGDVLDHEEPATKEYRLMIRNIYKGIKSGSVVLLTGNHDLPTYRLLFKPDITDESQAKKAFKYIRKKYSKYTKNTVNKLLGSDYCEMVYDAQKYCIQRGEVGNDYLTIVEDYYQSIEAATWILFEEELEIFNMLRYMAKASKMSERLTVGDHVLLLSHSGDENNAWSTKIYEPGFTPSEEISLYVVGHIAHNSISQLSGDDTNYCRDCNLDFINGTYVYNAKTKLLNIDDGSNCNIAEIQM